VATVNSKGTATQTKRPCSKRAKARLAGAGQGLLTHRLDSLFHLGHHKGLANAEVKRPLQQRAGVDEGLPCCPWHSPTKMDRSRVAVKRRRFCWLSTAAFWGFDDHRLGNPRKPCACVIAVVVHSACTRTSRSFEAAALLVELEQARASFKLPVPTNSQSSFGYPQITDCRNSGSYCVLANCARAPERATLTVVSSAVLPVVDSSKCACAFCVSAETLMFRVCA
jgi:hypothetical protein